MTTEPLNTEEARERLIRFATELADPHFSLSVPTVAKSSIRFLLAENATLRAQLSDMTRAFNDAVNVANAEKMRRTAIESTRTQEPPTGEPS